ncbi:MAG: hypothetical protein MUD01_12610 [Chloroflexaceae bacterium]|jgi:hypothetical protein|nr:hypothetical protein [Chloroflexaceae bacterium]
MATGRSLRAEGTGSVAEATIRGMLIGRGYAELRPKDLLEAPAVQESLFAKPRPSRIFVAQRPMGQGIYSTPIFADFWLSGPADFAHGLAIEVKWQQSGGSVDEKFPYLVENIRHCYPCDTVIVADGGGQRAGALAWLRRQVGGNLLGVFSLSEFLAWGNHRL